MRRCRLLLAISASLTLALGCSDPAVNGDLPIEEGDGDMTKADSVGVPFVGLTNCPCWSSLDHDANFGNSRLEQGGTAILTSEKAWQQFFLGAEPPADVDFSKEWVAFYGGGLQPTAGYSADILDLTYDAQAHKLSLETHFAGPGPDCGTFQVMTKPYTVVRFPIPTPQPKFAVSHHTDEEYSCTEE